MVFDPISQVGFRQSTSCSIENDGNCLGFFCIELEFVQTEKDHHGQKCNALVSIVEGM